MPRWTPSSPGPPHVSDARLVTHVRDSQVVNQAACA